jgi:mannosyltransferase OCH1-like enzyme
MNITNILVSLLIILIIFIVVNHLNLQENFNNENNINHIPKLIISTYYDKNKIPQKVFENIKTYAPNYKYIVYDDNEIIAFLKKYYPENVLQAFHELTRGAHKADLFRYCYLYIHGGIYLDIKTKLIEPIEQTFNIPNVNFYTVLSMHKPTIYQGIIASAPKNPIFLELIDHIVNVKKPIKRYFEFTADFYKKLRVIYHFYEFNNGYYKDKNNKFNLYLFEEKCSKNTEDCEDGLDKYKLCCYIYNKNKKIIKTRYSDFPWN